MNVILAWELFLIQDMVYWIFYWRKSGCSDIGSCCAKVQLKAITQLKTDRPFQRFAKINYAQKAKNLISKKFLKPFFRSYLREIKNTTGFLQFNEVFCMFGAEILETREKIRPRMKNMYVDVMYILVKFRWYTLVQCHFEKISRTL